MPFGPSNNSNDTPIGVEEHRVFAGPEQPSQGDVPTWDSATQRYLPSGGAGTFDIESVKVASGRSEDIQAPSDDGIANQVRIDFGGFDSWSAPETAQYEIIIQLNASRSTNPGFAYLWSYGTINGNQTGPAHVFKLANANDRQSYTVTARADLNQGDLVEYWIYRDSDGRNDGGLYPFDNPDGLDGQPSANIQIRHLEAV